MANVPDGADSLLIQRYEFMQKTPYIQTVFTQKQLFFTAISMLLAYPFIHRDCPEYKKRPHLMIH